jgi:predicted metal-dependent peptidase
MFVTNLTEEQRLAKAVVAIMGNPKYTALAGVLMIGDRTVTDDPSIPTACTNGRDEMYDRAFVSSLSDAELRFLVLHEVYHKLFNGGGSSKLQDQQPFDQHDWDGAQELTADEKRELARDLDEAIRQGALVAGKMGSGGDRDLEELLQPQVNWREALREFIQDTCAGKDYSTYRKPNRRYLSAGIYMPSGVTEQVGELILAIDTSGSIGNHELSAFLSEVKSICDTVHPDGIRLLYWDTQICRDEKYDSQGLDELVKSTKPKGGGGTDVTCVTDYIREHNINAQACIVLTDGYLFGGWGQWTMPVLWTILDNDGAKPDVGKTVNIKSRDM